jgi:hypothetical protein
MREFQFLYHLLREAHFVEYVPNEEYQLPVQNMFINPYAVSKFCAQSLVEALAGWLRKKSISPTVVFTVHDDRLIVIAGEYWLRAAESLGHEHVSGYYVTGSLRALALAEKIFREDVDAFAKFAEFSSTPDPLKERVYQYLSSHLAVDYRALVAMSLASCLPSCIREEFRVIDVEWKEIVVNDVV